MLSTTKPSPQRPSLHIPGPGPSALSDLFSDSREHGYQGPSRTVRFPRATPAGPGAIAQSEDGVRCAVAGQESLRIMRVSAPDEEGAVHEDDKTAVGSGGHRIGASRNLWTGSGLKMDSASTDVAWGHGAYDNKILTSARNGELIMWDINKAGSKYERRAKDHIRSIHKIAYSHIVPYYCVTASADEHIRIWDLRSMTRSINKIRQRASVRTVVLSPSTARPLEAVVGLENGSILRWDLTKGQLGQLAHVPVAHAGPVLALDWRPPADGGAWVASGGLDRCVKVWDLAPPAPAPADNKHRPRYTLRARAPAPRVRWRPAYACELAVVGEGVDVWDVRRGWVAKWAVAESEGATDIAWRDSHALWAHHASGAFAQLDVRNATRPLDAVPRAALSWHARGALAFAVDRGGAGTGEVPFDDVHPDVRELARERGGRLKALGDPPYYPATQAVGAVVVGEGEGGVGGAGVGEGEGEGEGAFARLARGYVLEGERVGVCERNAELAFAVGKEDAARAWLLVAALLTDLVPDSQPPPTPPRTPTSVATPPLPHSVSAPASVPILKTRTGKSGSQVSSRRASSSDPAAQQRGTSSPSPSRASSSTLHHRTDAPPPQRRNTPTPASSTSPSPRRVNVALPPLAPRRESGTSLFKPRALSLYRRPSVSRSVPESPGEGARSSLRHVGEGALDDSDSDSDGEEEEEEQARARAYRAPALGAKVAPATPSPLSRDSQEWSEGEEDRDGDGDDEEESPSPASTDTEGGEDADADADAVGDSSSERARARRSRSRSEPRSRSSTIASLAARAARPPLSQRGSCSSMRTVVAEAGARNAPLRRDDTVRDLRGARAGTGAGAGASSRATSRKASPAHTRQTSLALSGELISDTGHRRASKSRSPVRGRKRREEEEVRERERKLREVGWSALRDSLEVFADMGDVQTCAMLCMVAPNELRVGKERVVRFLEAYIGLSYPSFVPPPNL
ncbi:WD40 repeat-like protein [Gloeophyllum trabeum ATCC 11539]|uniref:WD40 repeat-like protein n=1 Tax=Gloeophyllum trabeum (strain ATCC 11539 / FP-39264 / Madison 617) TaxID=670483 RepID=S7RPV5_GLOTA|nr:WD40 repeat-like protein [Gloeophyllum trabeum ATCC 11539]EPQ54919.1 WD40 repeat-like protein [Gloeophyllum trabeum ATCC 11539]